MVTDYFNTTEVEVTLSARVVTIVILIIIQYNDYYKYNYK